MFIVTEYAALRVWFLVSFSVLQTSCQAREDCLLFFDSVLAVVWLLCSESLPRCVIGWLVCDHSIPGLTHSFLSVYEIPVP